MYECRLYVYPCYVYNIGGSGGSNIMQIYVRTKMGKSITVKISDSDAIENIKAEIEDKEGIPSYQHLLKFHGLQLQEWRTLSYYNIKSGSNLRLVQRHRG